MARLGRAYPAKAFVSHPPPAPPSGSAIGTVNDAAATVLGVGASTFAAVGSAAGSATVSGVGASTFAAVGNASGSATVSGVGASTFNAVASASGTGTVTGVGASTFNSVASSSGTGTATGVGASTFNAVGTVSDAAATVTGVGASTFNSVANASGTGTATGTPPGVTPAVGTVSDAGGVATGVGSWIISAVATASGSADVEGFSPPATKAVGWIGRKRWFEELQEEYAEKYRRENPESKPTKAKKAVLARVKLNKEIVEEVSGGLLSELNIEPLVKLATLANNAPRQDVTLEAVQRAREYLNKLREEDEDDILIMAMAL